MKAISILTFFSLLLIGCEKYYLTIKKEEIHKENLASTFAMTPDPRQDHPPVGQKLYLSWYLPMEDIKPNTSLFVHVVFHDYSKKVYAFPVTKKRGFQEIAIADEEYLKTGGLLTYRAEIVDDIGTPIKQWQQALWTDIIKFQNMKH